MIPIELAGMREEQQVLSHEGAIAIGDGVAAVVGDVESVELRFPAIVETIAEARVQRARRDRSDLSVLG